MRETKPATSDVSFMLHDFLMYQHLLDMCCDLDDTLHKAVLNFYKGMNCTIFKSELLAVQTV